MNVAILAIAVIALAGIPSAFACTEGNVQHWMNIQITLTNPLQHSTEPNIAQGDQFFLPIPTMGSEIISTDQRDVIVSDRLNELGYTDSDGQPVSVFDIENVNLSPQNVGYSTICKDGIQQMIGGMLLQPDAMTLALAYGITNSIWMAPLAIGIGAGIYLTKSRLKKKVE